MLFLGVNFCLKLSYYHLWASCGLAGFLSYQIFSRVQGEKKICMKVKVLSFKSLGLLSFIVSAWHRLMSKVIANKYEKISSKLPIAAQDMFWNHQRFYQVWQNKIFDLRTWTAGVCYTYNPPNKSDTLLTSRCDDNHEDDMYDTW